MTTPVRYLFERLSDPASGVCETPDPLVAIRENVQRIVAGARGPFDGEAGLFGFGLKSPVELGRGSVVQRAAFMRELAALVTRWERRLKNVTVEEEFGADEGPLRLVLRAQLSLGGAADEVRFPLEVP